MKKENYSILLILFIGLFVLSSCQKQPQAYFSASKNSVYVSETINFTNTTINGETFIWDFGDGNISHEMNPSHSYSSGGTFIVKLTAFSKNGKKTSESFVNIKVKNIIKFNNSIYTDIFITVNSTEKSVSPGESIVFYDVPESVPYTAYTSGKTSSGSIVGLELIWNNTIDLSDSYTINLIATNEYFFLYLNNVGSNSLSDLYVNYGLASQTYDNIIIPNNGVTYKLGYYKAWTNSNVYLSLGSSTVYWDPISLPFTENQTITLSNNYKIEENKFTNLERLNSPFKLNATFKKNQKFDINNDAINEYCK